MGSDNLEAHNDLNRGSFGGEVTAEAGSHGVAESGRRKCSQVSWGSRKWTQEVAWFRASSPTPRLAKMPCEGRGQDRKWTEEGTRRPGYWPGRNRKGYKPA